MKSFWVLAAALTFFGCSSRTEVHLPGGDFVPQYGGTLPGERFKIAPFRLDKFPVTNQQYAAFVATNPQWSRQQASVLFVDHKYLSHWVGSPEFPPPADKQRPVVNVSWFAANAYCAWRNQRLPTVLEWEYAAAASDTAPDASLDPDFVQKLLEWYGRPAINGNLAAIGQGNSNYWGVHDLHGLVWEWTADFNSVFVAGDNRRDGEQLQNLFCGGGAASSSDRANYAAFMRYALRNSLKANYSLSTLGFRCARDAEGAI